VTSFVASSWTDADRDLVRLWLRGERCAGHRSQLTDLVARGFPPTARVVLFNSGRAAIHAALAARRFPAGSEVLIPSYACTGVVTPVLSAGLAPVYYDIDDEFNAALDSVRAAAGPKTVAVVFPHLAGRRSAATEALVEWARGRSLFTIEDATQAEGLAWDGRPAGARGDAGVFSAGPGKTTCGPGGGWLVINDGGPAPETPPREPDPTVLERLRAFVRRFEGSEAALGRRRLWELALERVRARRAPRRTGTVDVPVFDISDIEAALAHNALLRLAGTLAGQRDHAARWEALFQKWGLPFARPAREDNTCLKFWLAARTPDQRGPLRAFRHWLTARGVLVEGLYTPLHRRAPFAGFRRTDLPRTEARWAEAFAVPTRPNLPTDFWARWDGPGPGPAEGAGT
jgi:dTDP-4-amino-4,6-dideoxygalactose transaminase